MSLSHQLYCLVILLLLSLWLVCDSSAALGWVSLASCHMDSGVRGYTHLVHERLWSSNLHTAHLPYKGNLYNLYNIYPS